MESSRRDQPGGCWRSVRTPESPVRATFAPTGVGDPAERTGSIGQLFRRLFGYAGRAMRRNAGCVLITTVVRALQRPGAFLGQLAAVVSGPIARRR